MQQLVLSFQTLSNHNGTEQMLDFFVAHSLTDVHTDILSVIDIDAVKTVFICSITEHQAPFGVMQVERLKISVCFVLPQNILTLSLTVISH